MESDYDAIVVGGGPAGATAAVLLAQAGWRIALVEKAVFPRRKVCGEFISGSTWALLRQLGMVGALEERAGPPVRRVGVYAGDAMVTAELPASGDHPADCGRALGREHLDTLLLDHAIATGAQVWQPWVLSGFAADAAGYDCTITGRDGGPSRLLRTPVIIAAHGSWESGVMPTQVTRPPYRASDLLGFKANFTGADLPADLMPLIAFPGGYGGMVHTGAGRVSLSCCIRREHLAQCRKKRPRVRAGTAVLSHMVESCKGLALALSTATADGAWLAAGPLRTGVRTFGRDGIFAVGNAAAEAHPIVAEGISIAIRSAALLCRQLIARQEFIFSDEVLAAIREDYAAAWHREFALRTHLAAAFAQLFIRPVTARMAAGVLERVPQLLTQGARWSGKADRSSMEHVT